MKETAIQECDVDSDDGRNFGNKWERDEQGKEQGEEEGEEEQQQQEEGKEQQEEEEDEGGTKIETYRIVGPYYLFGLTDLDCCTPGSLKTSLQLDPFRVMQGIWAVIGIF
ncbi:hypothetical protein DPSP01_004666 [Paraphaeosphaeria sporulosa]